VTTMNAAWHRAHVMPKNATPQQRLDWHLEHQKRCGCRKLTAAQKAKLVEAVARAKQRSGR